MGSDKALLEVDGQRLVDRAVAALTAVADPVLEVGPGWSGLPAVREDPPGSGPLAAVSTGAAALRRAGHQGPVLVLSVDMPKVGVDLLRLKHAVFHDASDPNVQQGQGEKKLRRHHTDNGVDILAERDRFADNRRVGGETALPEAMADKRYRAAGGRAFGWLEASAYQRLRCQHVKEIWRYARCIELLGLLASGECEGVGSEGRDSRKRAVAVADAFVSGQRERDTL